MGLKGERLGSDCIHLVQAREECQVLFWTPCYGVEYLGKLSDRQLFKDSSL